MVVLAEDQTGEERALSGPAGVQKIESSGEVDRDLVLRARDGDEDAFAEIVRAHQRRVYGVAMRMTRRHGVADDITQETFIRAYRNLGRFELGRPLTPWLVKIAVNLSINHLNGPARRERALYTEDNPEGPSTRADVVREPLESNPLRSLLSGDFARALSNALDELSPDHRVVFVLKVDEGMRYDDIAKILGISRGTVMSRLFRARAKLKAKLVDYL